MKKTNEPHEKVIYSSGEFTKSFIKHFIINALIIGILIGILTEIGNSFLPSIFRIILSILLLILGIAKIYLSSINDTFYEGKIYRKDANQIAKNITITFIVVFGIYILIDILKFSKLAAIGLASLGLTNFIIEIVGSLVLCIIVVLASRKRFYKECEKPENIAE